MRYAISYVSNANPNLSKDDLTDLFKKVTRHNNNKNITGILLSSESNFFQFLEGEKEEIKILYSQIEEDKRHNNIIKILEKPIPRSVQKSFVCGVISEETKYNLAELETYFRHIEALDFNAQKAIKRVIEAMMT